MCIICIYVYIYIYVLLIIGILGIREFKDVVFEDVVFDNNNNNNNIFGIDVTVKTLDNRTYDIYELCKIYPCPCPKMFYIIVRTSSKQP